MNGFSAVLSWLFVAGALHVSVGAADLTGRVLFVALPVPGATVTATRPAEGDTPARTVTTTSDEEGAFRFADLQEGAWTLSVEMRGFVTASKPVIVPGDGSPAVVELTLRPYEEIVRAGAVVDPLIVTDPPPGDVADIINGSLTNGAASPFAQSRAIGNNRPSRGAVYTGGVSASFGNSAWNARPYVFGEHAAPVPASSDLQLGVTFGGPLKIPRLISSGLQAVVNVQHEVAHNSVMQSALMPTEAQRAGDFSGSSTTIRDPFTGLPFDGNVVPPDRISPQAAALLRYYPLPTGATAGGGNYQGPVTGKTTLDLIQVAMNKNQGVRNVIAGSFSFQRSIADTVGVFGFLDSGRQSSLNANASWVRRWSTRMSLRTRYQYARVDREVTPFFANRTNVSGDAGIAGNDQDPLNWGPPSISFPDIAGLSDVTYERSASGSHTGGVELLVRRGPHNLTLGGDVRRNAFDLRSQPDPRGTLAFTGAVTGDAFADFLIGVPTTSSIASGQADVNLRGMSYDAYISDDFRVHTRLTLVLGVRWEYESPFVETHGRLANLDVAPGFTAVTPVVGTDPRGAITGATYPASLLEPDWRGIQPRLGAAWRPVLGSSMLIKASYGRYRNLGMYQSLAQLLAQQPPFATTFSVHNSLETPLTLANPFPPSVPSTATFAVDPALRSGHAHAWQASFQQDLPGSLTLLAVYDGARGGSLMQAFLPNTYPVGAANPCETCPAGFTYVTSTGTSLRHAGQFTLRRRLHAGLMASVQYTIARATDDAASFANRVQTPAALSIAQDWLNLDAERGPSAFDQRHLVSAQVQYTTGVGAGGGAFMEGTRGALFKDWTITSQLNAGSGLPSTPTVFLALAGTGSVGVRPARTGEPITPTTSGSYANPAAFTAPLPGVWGDAERNSVRGPGQFSLDMSVSRVFRLRGRVNLEWRVASTNPFNIVTFAAINTVVGSPQFGFPTRAHAMRRVHMTLRLRF